jgi:gliding motility-associated-like protein
MTVSVNSSVTPTFTQSGPYCQNAILAQVMLPSSSIEGITGSWNPGMISTANAGDIVHSFTADAGQCATNTTMTIVVNAEVLSTFTQVEPVCEGGTFVLPSNSLEGIPGSWSPAINNINSTPYTFTPDGDKLNQTFQPVFTKGYDPFSYNMVIMNRWGEIIFESNDAKVGWDGTYGDKIAQDGIYIWRINFRLKSTDERKIITGHLNLIR